MSGYIAVLVRNELLHSVSSLVNKGEAVHIPISADRTLVYVSPTRNVQGNALFQGFATDFENRTMIFPGAPELDLPDPKRPVDGSYFTGRVEENSVRFGADLYGYVSMVWFTSPHISAVSDSFLSLIALRREFGLSCTPNEETIRGRMWLNSMSYQQLGLETYCEGVYYCTPGSELIFDIATGTLKANALNLVETFQGSVASHAQAVRESASRMIQTMQAYAATGGIMTLGLSGGTDSRLCLAAALAADMDDRLHVASKDNGTNDFEVAVELSEAFHFPLNSSRPEVHGTLVPRDGASTWAAGSLGVYDALYATDRFRRVNHPVFAVAGQGAEASKGNFGWRKITSIGMPPEGLAQCRRALDSIGCDPEDKWGSEWHYLAFRNGIHAGRGTQNAEYLPRPAAQIPLIGLSRSSLNEFPTPRKHQPNIVLDTLIVMNPGLAAHRFDDPLKNASQSFIQKRLDALGGPINPDELEPYEVVGTPTPSPGYSRTLLEIAASMGFIGKLSGENLAPFVRTA